MESQLACAPAKLLDAHPQAYICRVLTSPRPSPPPMQKSVLTSEVLAKQQEAAKAEAVEAARVAPIKGAAKVASSVAGSVAVSAAVAAGTMCVDVAR